MGGWKIELTEEAGKLPYSLLNPELAIASSSIAHKIVELTGKGNPEVHREAEQDISNLVFNNVASVLSKLGISEEQINAILD